MYSELQELQNDILFDSHCHYKMLECVFLCIREASKITEIMVNRVVRQSKIVVMLAEFKKNITAVPDNTFDQFSYDNPV